MITKMLLIDYLLVNLVKIYILKMGHLLPLLLRPIKLQIHYKIITTRILNVHSNLIYHKPVINWPKTRGKWVKKLITICMRMPKKDSKNYNIYKKIYKTRNILNRNRIHKLI